MCPPDTADTFGQVDEFPRPSPTFELEINQLALFRPVVDPFNCPEETFEPTTGDTPILPRQMFLFGDHVSLDPWRS